MPKIVEQDLGQRLRAFRESVRSLRCMLLYLDRVLSSLGRVYLLRVPLLTGFGFVGVCFLAFTRAKSLMGGAFDINSYGGIFWVSLIAFLFASAVEVAWRLVRCYGPKRVCGDPLCNPNLGWSGAIGYPVLILLVALPAIGGAIYRSTELSFPYKCKDLSFLHECTVLHVRGSAQRGTNEVALDLLIQKWGEKGGKHEPKDEKGEHHVEITRAIFSFDGKDAPTSWHLPEKQKVAIHDNWNAEVNKECNNNQGWDKVADFLGAKADPGEPNKLDGGAQAPKNWPAKPVNIAHRGGRYIAPENTLIGFQEGLLRAGVDVLEFDVHLTADGHLVVIHDDSVDRTTDGTGLVRNMTLQEIKRLDAGNEFTDDDGKTCPYRDLGVTVPTLKEVYQAFPKTPVNIEIKVAQPGIEQALWQTIKEAEGEDRPLVVSGKMDVIRRFREISGGRVATGSSIR